jgi:hypothetical protein
MHIRVSSELDHDRLSLLRREQYMVCLDCLPHGHTKHCLIQTVNITTFVDQYHDSSPDWNLFSSSALLHFSHDPTPPPSYMSYAST